jgi:hypothetical protein
VQQQPAACACKPAARVTFTCSSSTSHPPSWHTRATWLSHGRSAHHTRQPPSGCLQEARSHNRDKTTAQHAALPALCQRPQSNSKVCCWQATDMYCWFNRRRCQVRTVRALIPANKFKLLTLCTARTWGAACCRLCCCVAGPLPSQLGGSNATINLAGQLLSSSLAQQQTPADKQQQQQQQTHAEQAAAAAGRTSWSAIEAQPHKSIATAACTPV